MNVANFQLKFLAFLFMVIDHVGAVFFPDVTAYRAIGRLSFPLYAYFFAQGYKFTKDHLVYYTRLLLIGLLSQAFYCQLFNNYNIVLTFAANLLLLRAVHYANKIYLKIPILLVGAGLLSYFNFDYGWYSTFLIIMFLNYESKDKNIGIHNFWTYAWFIVPIFTITRTSLLQPLASFSLFLLPNQPIKDKPSKKLQYIFYALYPGHLAIILVAYNYLKINHG